MIKICEKGYIHKVNTKGYDMCMECSDGSYSFDPSAKACLPCPLDIADCKGSNIFLPPGYWKFNSNSN